MACGQTGGVALRLEREQMYVGKAVLKYGVGGPVGVAEQLDVEEAVSEV